MIKSIFFFFLFFPFLFNLMCSENSNDFIPEGLIKFPRSFSLPDSKPALNRLSKPKITGHSPHLEDRFVTFQRCFYSAWWEERCNLIKLPNKLFFLSSMGKALKVAKVSSRICLNSYSVWGWLVHSSGADFASDPSKHLFQWHHLFLIGSPPSEHYIRKVFIILSAYSRCVEFSV